MKDYSNLGYGIGKETVQRCYSECLQDSKAAIRECRLHIFEQLFEITERAAYEVMNEPIKHILDEGLVERISEFICSNIDYEDYDIMDTVTTIVLSVELDDVWEKILQNKKSIKNEKVIGLIDDCIKDAEETGCFTE